MDVQVSVVVETVSVEDEVHPVPLTHQPTPFLDLHRSSKFPGPHLGLKPPITTVFWEEKDTGKGPVGHDDPSSRERHTDQSKHRHPDGHRDGEVDELPSIFTEGTSRQDTLFLCRLLVGRVSPVSLSENMRGNFPVLSVQLSRSRSLLSLSFLFRHFRYPSRPPGVSGSQSRGVSIYTSVVGSPLTPITLCTLEGPHRPWCRGLIHTSAS